MFKSERKYQQKTHLTVEFIILIQLLDNKPLLD